MPISDSQTAVLRILSGNRSRSAYLAGGLIGVRGSPRFSADIDYFHDTADLALETFKIDRDLLLQAGYTVDAPDVRPGFVRAIISKNDQSVRVDWAHEASWHFFQPVENPDVGYELHWADAATNKILAMASRSEIRDGFDALFWHRNPLSLGSLIWAAAGKDLGLMPGTILEEMRRNARVTPDDLAMLKMASPIDVKKFGIEFRQAAREAEALILEMPPALAGCFFLDPQGGLIDPDPRNPETLSRPLRPSRGGLVPVVESRFEP